MWLPWFVRWLNGSATGLHAACQAAMRAEWERDKPNASGETPRMTGLLMRFAVWDNIITDDGL